MTDFRIGNLCRDKISGELLMVIELREENERIGFLIINKAKSPLPDGWKAEPIPLSYELLGKCGFIDPAKNGLGQRISVNSVDELCWYSQDNCLKYQTKGSGFSRDFNIKYLHQLQNIYFMLTMAELTINL